MHCAPDAALTEVCRLETAQNFFQSYCYGKNLSSLTRMYFPDRFPRFPVR